MAKNQKKKVHVNIKRRGTFKGVSRARANMVLAQGVGTVARRAIGITKKTSIPRGLTPECWNAHSSVHAGLPRAVGPYTVVRTTSLLTTNSPMMIFGTYSLPNWLPGVSPTTFACGSSSGPKTWSNVCAIGAAEDLTASEFKTSQIGSDNCCQLFTIPIPGSKANGVFGYNVAADETPYFESEWAATSAVPSAMSVQVINPNPMQAAGGNAVAAVCPVRLDLINSEKTWDKVGGEILAYYRPRVMSGGKLALRGVQMDSLPLSMTDVSDFRELWELDPKIAAPSRVSWTGKSRAQGIANAPAASAAEKTFNTPLSPEGWAPIVYYSPTNAAAAPADRQPMSFLVTMEWRVRFDISNPACASHTAHKPSTDNEWHNMIQKASAALPGVIDIADKVADAGLRIGPKVAAIWGGG